MTIRTMLLLTALIINMVTAIIYKVYRLLCRSDVLFTHIRQYVDKNNQEDDNLSTSYFLIPGFLNQSMRSFTFLDKILKHNCDIYYMDYDNYGYDPKLYTSHLFHKVSEITKKQMEAGKAVEHIAISISMGDQITASIAEVFDQVIAINPCTYKTFLNFKFKKLIALGAPFLVITEFLLGWLAFLPIVQVDYGYFSIALIADQLSAMNTLKPSESMRMRNISKKIILSNHDQFLDNQAIEEYYQNADIVYIDCKHGTMSDPNDGQIYLQGLQRLCNKKSVTDYPYPWRRTRMG